MRYFKLRDGAGKHDGPINHGSPEIIGNIKTYTPGEVVASEQDLCVLFPNKYDEVGAPEEVVKKTKAKKVEVEEPVAEEEPEEAPENPLGHDVTSRFAKQLQAAKAEEQFVILQNKEGKFNMADKENPEESLNAEPLTAKDVKELIKIQSER